MQARAWTLAITAIFAVAAQVATAGDGCDPSKWKLPVDGRYNTEGKIVEDKLNVHLIAHSHDDPGFLKTVDQYYMQRIQFVLDTVVEELLRDPNRKFMFVEQSFFQRWWHQQSEDVKAITKQLVKEGRLDLSVNGGWCMHDEATPHYSAMVDQTAYGHQLLMDEFGITPRIGWQIDPFGHSATQGSLLSEGVGFDALYFARIDYQDYDTRKRSKNLEFIWRPSKSRGKYSQVFTGEMQNMYIAPSKFDYENQDNWVQDDPALHDFNVCDQVDSFVGEAMGRSSVQKGNHLFIPMGTDLTYDAARRWYKNMDKLIHYINQDNRINVLYSNLSYYTDLKRAENLTWAVKTDDFFPFATGVDDYWSGFFSSRPTLKRFTRVSNILLQQIRQLNAVYQSNHSVELDALQRAVGLVQHHDGLSGTEKQAVANDYALRLNDGIIKAEEGMNRILSEAGAKEPYHLCLLANTSVCEVSTTNQEFEALVHNALPRKSIEIISIPLAHPVATVQIIDGGGVIRRQDVYKALPVHPVSAVAPYSLVFSVELPPLSLTRFHVKQDRPADFIGLRPSEEYTKMEGTAADDKVVTLENELMRVDIDAQTGFIRKLTNKKKRVEMPLSATMRYYHAYQLMQPSSGAYTFRPDGNKTYPVGRAATENLTATLINLAVDSDSASASRVAFKIGDWVTLEYRLNDGDEFVEIEWTVGPVPIDDNVGKEVIFHFDTGNAIKSDKAFFTDSNGLEFMKRVRNHRDTWNLTLHDDVERVAANYFPITTGAYIKDSTRQLNVVTDRAQGTASLQDGQFEVMVHRRLLADDNKGVAEPLNETESVYDASKKTEVTKGLTVRGNFFINVDSAHDGMQSLRSKMEKQFFRPLIALRKPDPSDDGAWKLPWLTVNEFPPNVGLTTLVELSKQCVMARLSHLFAVDEHSELSKAATVDFGALFSVKGSAVSEVKELSLTGVTDVRDGPSSASEWNTEGESEEDGVASPSIPVYGTSVVLQPIEVRTFRVCFGKGEDVDEVSVDVLKSVESPSIASYEYMSAEIAEDEAVGDVEDTSIAVASVTEMLAVE